MILTVTPNPSLDKTVELSAPLAVGHVQRAAQAHAEPGGKGVNVSRALTAAGVENLAVLPGDPADPVLTGLAEISVSCRSMPIGQSLRTNIAITDPLGTTTKVNEPGPQFSAEAEAEFIELIIGSAAEAAWTVLAGSLPPGLSTRFYRETITRLRSAGEHLVAVDASGPALAEAVAAAPDLIKPNAEELLELAHALLEPEQIPELSAAELEASKDAVVQLVRALKPHGVQAALVTLGGHGAVYVSADQHQPVLSAWGPSLTVRSTVGAGDAALAGFLAAHVKGEDPRSCLRRAMAQGRAAASLPGSTMPVPEQLVLDDVVVAELTP